MYSIFQKTRMNLVNRDGKSDLYIKRWYLGRQNLQVMKLREKLALLKIEASSYYLVILIFFLQIIH